MDKVSELKELTLLNMCVYDVASPNLLFEEYPKDCHLIPKLIFNVGKDLFIEHIILRDESFGDRWRTANNHYFAIDNDFGKIQCWCACNTQDAGCRCGCMHIFHILIEKI